MSITDSQLQTILGSLENAKDLYHQLILVVGPSGSGKTEVLKQIAAQENSSVINVNLEISSRLLELTRKQRKTKLQTIFYDGTGPVPEQIHSYLSTNWKEMRNLSKQDPALVAKAKGRWYVPDPSKAGDLEKLRDKALLKEFEEYKQSKKKLKIFRLEAVRIGFKKAWQERDYKTIVAIAEKIPTSVLEEDPKLLMWYDQALTRIGDY